MKYYDRQGKELTLKEWANLFEIGYERIVKQSSVGDVSVSTVWLGIDHSFGGPVPLIFETMIFGGEHDQYQERYATEEAAIRSHEQIVEQLKVGEFEI